MAAEFGANESSFHGVASASLRLKMKRWLTQLNILSGRFENAWVLMDRGMQADDNAEHLYRHIRKEHPGVNIWFVLARSSHDWRRLKHDGFRLLAAGSLGHKLALLRAKHLVSSHIDAETAAFLPRQSYGDLMRWDFTFLQHGVINNDMSEWFKNKPLKIDHFVTSGQKEYESIASDDSPYDYGSQEVVLTGLPRHDRLFEKKTERAGKLVLIMPTWRRNIAGAVQGPAYRGRSKNPEFAQSVFFKTWLELLTNPIFKRTAKDAGLRPVFVPHPGLKPSIEDFRARGVDVLGYADVDSVQDLLLEGFAMITDFSSIAFEMAYLERPILYYQFDGEDVFGGEHIYRKGYFDYHRDGFGPVCTNIDELIVQFQSMVEGEGQPVDPYATRMREFFAFRDGRCCERVFRVISGEYRDELCNSCQVAS